MPEWRTLSLDFMTGAPVAEISLSGLKFGARLRDVGTASGTLTLPALQAPTTDTGYLDFTTEDGDLLWVESGGEVSLIDSIVPISTRAQAAALNDAVSANRRQLVIDRDGVIVWCGPVASAPYDDATNSRTVSAVEDWAVWRRRFNDQQRIYTGTDQLAIARALVTACQSVPGGDIRVTVGTETCGVVRDHTYERYDLKSYAEAIEQLANLENGFDFAIEPSWDPATGELVKTLRLSYPRRGRNYLQSGLVFELGRNIETFKWPDDGTRQANKVWATGNGSEDAMLIASAQDANQIRSAASGGPGYPLLEKVAAYSTVEQQATLDSHARADLATVAKPVELPEITVKAGEDPIFGSYILGDAARIIIPPDMSAGFPDGIDTYRRIVGWDVTVSDEGAESVKLYFSEEPTYG